ncbi:MAG: serine/threonine-protein kinase [Candidatus Hydrogenedentes bacterium]|nr:serine/threonine-protein kinase [Candidatus Hydrogenedentota bacterium]
MTHEGQNAPARTLFGNYEIIDTVGKGGMGVVYRAVDLALDRVVALKVLPTDFTSRPDVVSRFHREARAVAQLDHPNIVQTYSAGSVDDVPYIAMELIHGRSLGRIMKAERRLPWERALHVAEQVANALSCAHEAQIIHRDIKPPNILLTDSGHVYVTDFGLAKILTVESQLTVDGARLGTPQYMSPEQCRNETVTPSTDLYSLGVVMFAMIAGRLPYSSKDKADLIMRIIKGKVARLREFVPDVPEDIERLVAYLLENDPRNRPPDAAAAADLIARVRCGEGLPESGDGVAEALADLRHDIAETPTPSSASRAAAGTGWLAALWDRAQARWRGLPVIARWGIVIVAAILGGLGLGAQAARTFCPDPGIQPAPSASAHADRWRQPSAVARFVVEAPGVLLVEFDLPGFAVTDVQWPGAGEYAVVVLDGLPGSPREGQRAICLASPSQQRSALAVPPSGRAGHVVGPAPFTLIGCVQSDAGSSPLAGRFLLRCNAPAMEDGASCRHVLACPVDNAVPAALIELPAPAAASPVPVPYEPISAFDVDPAGANFAAASHRGDGHDDWVLVQCPVAVTESAPAPLTLTTEGRPIVLVQYAPDGSRIAYLRQHGPRDKELWIVKADGGGLDGIRVAEGDISVAPRAFGPSGRRLVIAEAQPGRDAVLRVMNVVHATTELELGAGGAAVWRRDGDGLVATMRDRRGQLQLCAIDPASPDAPAQLTYLDGGTATACAVSGDGAWAAAIPLASAEPAVCFVNLAQVLR